MNMIYIPKIKDFRSFIIKTNASSNDVCESCFCDCLSGMCDCSCSCGCDNPEE